MVFPTGSSVKLREIQKISVLMSSPRCCGLIERRGLIEGPSWLMKLTYDRDNNIACLRLRPKGEEAETIRVSDELNIDIAPDGSVYGIELLNANEQMRSANGGNLVLVDDVERRKMEIPLGAG